jgi:hypothetical protein
VDYWQQGGESPARYRKTMALESAAALIFDVFSLFPSPRAIAVN